MIDFGSARLKGDDKYQNPLLNLSSASAEIIKLQLSALHEVGTTEWLKSLLILSSPKCKDAVVANESLWSHLVSDDAKELVVLSRLKGFDGKQAAIERRHTLLPVQRLLCAEF